MLRPNFADLDDAATFCGTAFPESSKPLILLMMASGTHGVCLFGDAGAFGADLSDAMLSAEKWFNYWGPSRRFRSRNSMTETRCASGCWTERMGRSSSWQRRLIRSCWVRGLALVPETNAKPSPLMIKGELKGV